MTLAEAARLTARQLGVTQRPAGCEPPAAPGAYVLLLALPAPLRLRVGQLGICSLPAGIYAYVGSAHGPGGLAARVRRHQRSEKRLHWHIDALLVHASLEDVIWEPGETHRECAWCRCLLNAGAQPVIRGFGSSDCRQACPAHLLRLSSLAAPAAARRALNNLERNV